MTSAEALVAGWVLLVLLLATVVVLVRSGAR